MIMGRDLSIVFAGGGVASGHFYKRDDFPGILIHEIGVLIYYVETENVRKGCHQVL